MAVNSWGFLFVIIGMVTLDPVYIFPSGLGVRLAGESLQPQFGVGVMREDGWFRPCLHKVKTQIFPCGLASFTQKHEKVFITENDYF